MNNIIPIFPLSLVVFPHSRYPLHIFEPRYKKLINLCLKEKTGFGIVTFADKNFHDIGCYVEIKEVINVSASEEMDIIVKGIRRFRMINHWENEETGYSMAEVEKYDDLMYSYDPILFVEARKIFKHLIKRINYKLDDFFWNNLSRTELKSFKLAEKSGFDLSQQLTLLELRDEGERLNYIINHLQKLEKYLDEKTSLLKLVINDGYIN